MELAIISDTHMPRGNRALPEACVERLRGRRTRSCTPGDFTALEVLALLERLGPPVHAVHGNVDEPEVRMRLPAVRVVKAGGAQILMTHDGGPAARRLARLRARFTQADAVVFGHSHLPLHEEARRLPHLQSRLADRAPARAAAHDGLGARRGRAAGVSPDRALTAPLRCPRWICRSSSPARPGRCPPRGAGCPRCSCGRAATGCCSTAARGPSSSCCAPSGCPSSTPSS